PEDVELIYLEDLAAKMPATCKRQAFISMILPGSMKRMCPKSYSDIRSVATVLFSSGSTGTPKGVVLTHHNFTSNLSGLMRVCAVDKDDSLLGSMPMFHCFGFLSAFWMPLSQHN
ncbi:MAG: AMP-binding protein, partial [Lentisphaeraceae bacterium]|nr:AMP-binding protein [Lentisphaeraceae bacterium]